MAKRKAPPKPTPKSGYQYNGAWHTYYDLGRKTGEEIKRTGTSNTEMQSGFSGDWQDSNGRTRKGEALGYPRSYYQGLRDGLGLTRQVTIVRDVRTPEGRIVTKRWQTVKPETVDHSLEFRKWCRDNAAACARYYKSGGTTEGLHRLWLNQVKAGE